MTEQILLEKKKHVFFLGGGGGIHLGVAICLYWKKIIF